MAKLVIDRRFRGPPNSGNGGYVCGSLAGHLAEGGVEVTLRAPPLLERPLDIAPDAAGGIEMRDHGKLLATARPVILDRPDVPGVTFQAAEEAVGRTPYDEHTHNLPGCFVCGPARGQGDGLRIFAGPLQAKVEGKPVVFAASWVPDDNLSGEDGRVAPEFLWAALDCPTGYCGVGARHLGMKGDETALLGRMAARIDRRPRPNDRCVVVAWPTGRDGRKLFAESALLSAEQDVLAVARTTWLLVDPQVQRGAGA